MTAGPSYARQVWMHYEAIHDVIYFSPRASEQAAALGMRGFWMGYFAFRAAPLGVVTPATVTAVFFGFHRSRVERALPDAWSYASPEEAISARERAVDQALRDVLGAPSGEYRLEEAAELAWRAAQAAETAGRPLAAGNQALPRSDNPRIALWQATSVLREHRGDGHNAVLVGRGIGPAEAHWLKIAAGESDGPMVKEGRRFPDAEWEDARRTLHAQGLLDGRGALTELGSEEHRAVERATDAAAEQPWSALHDGERARLLDLLRPVASAVIDEGLVPRLNGVGIVWQ